MKINTINLKCEIEKINTLIKEYDEIQLNLFNELKDSCINWQDNNSIDFEEQCDLEKRETEFFIDSLQEIKNMYEFIYEKYQIIGKEIYYNFKKKNSILKKIEDCEVQIENIITAFCNIDNTIEYKYYQIILEHKNILIKMKDKIYKLEIEINNIFKKIEAIEKEIKSKIDNLEKININNFDFCLK